MLKVILPVAALVLAGCASGNKTTSTATETTADTQQETAEVVYICTSEHVVGTNFKRRRCRTQEQIDQEREQAQRELSEFQRSTISAPIDN